MTPLSPLSDSKIARSYSVRSLQDKVQNKTALQRELGWPMEPKAAMLCLPAGMSEGLGGTLFRELLPGLLTLPLQIVVLGMGSAEYGELFTKLAKERQHRLAIIPNAEENIRKMYAASDMAIFLTEPADRDELAHCLRYGVVPVAPESRQLENYNPVQETGDAFLFDNPESVWSVYAAIVRALETFKFPFDWRTIQRHGMEKAGIKE
ncbi:MAG: hypothetical protein PHS73_00270 [Candidatus Peribacteraceae bacterium]|nr:hypothetical protein [Candidatus Peribacteraceae bacterium]